MAERDFKWYVYELSDHDGNVFYVGKGSGNRIDQHEIEARTDKNSHKCNKIRAIWESGNSVVKTKVAFFCDEQKAYIHEANRIAEYGIDNLTNSVFATTLVTDKNLVKDSSKNAYDVIKALESKFVSWVRVTKFGERKVVVTGGSDLNRILTEKFYNDFCNKAFLQAIKSRKYAYKIRDLLLKHNIFLTFAKADDYVSV